MNDPAGHAIRAVIRGRVQGVGYRAWAAGTARALGLSGWVRNRSDGSVEAVLRGPGEAVAAMLDACRKGPPSARVEAISTHETTAGAAGQDGFELRETV